MSNFQPVEIVLLKRGTLRAKLRRKKLEELEKWKE